MNTSVNNPANNNRVNNKIEDFGQKIGGARKDYAAQTIELVALFAGVTVEQLKQLSLSKVVKLEQLQRLAVAGAIPASAACAAWALWRTIETKPSMSRRVAQWADKTAGILAEISAIIGGAEITENVKNLPEYRVLMAANYPAEPFTFGHYRVTPYDTAYWMESYRRKGLAVCSGSYYKFKSTEGDAAACAAFIRQAVASDAARRSEGATFELHSGSGLYWASPKGKDKIHVQTWKTRSEAIEGMKNVDALRELWAKIRETPALRRATNRPRVGADYRQGESITPEKFATAFPFRGVEFGNWLTQADRVIRLNETFDALHDLCSLCGLSADAATLKSWLAMAFGSRGIPGAAAHFEHDHRVINLTKEHGAGSLAHEWFHALDAFTAARFDGSLGQFAVKDWGRLPEGELREASRALYSALVKSPFARRSEDLDYLKGKDYYGTIQELAARAFECYVIELAKIQGWQLDFLANVITREEWLSIVGNADRYPYPTPEEVAELAPAFARFLSIAADAQELSREASELFAEGRAIMQQQREQQQALEAQAKEEQAQLRKEALDARKAEMETKAAAVCDECGATWHFVFDSASAVYAIGGGAGFIFVIWHSMRVGYRVCQYNNRLKKSVRPCWQYVLQVKPGTDIEAYARKDLKYGFSMCSVLYEVFKNTYSSTWQEFNEKHADELKKAAAEFAPAKAIDESAEKAPETPADGAKISRTSKDKAEGSKAEKTKENGKTKDVDMNAAPAAGLHLVEIAGGVAVIGDDWKDTYYHKRDIKAHGATWNKDAKQWQATDPTAVASLRAWFGVAADKQPATTADASAASTSDNSTDHVIEAPKNQASLVAEELPEWFRVGAIVRVGPYACKIDAFDLMADTVTYHCNPDEDSEVVTVPGIRHFIHQKDITAHHFIDIPEWLTSGVSVLWGEDGKEYTVTEVCPDSLSEVGYCVKLAETSDWANPKYIRRAPDTPHYSSFEKSQPAELWAFSTAARWAKPFMQFTDETAALDYLDKVKGKEDGRYMEKGVVLQVIRTNPYWHILFNPETNVYTMVFVLRQGENNVLQTESLRHLLLQTRENHIRDVVKGCIERIGENQVLALSAEGSRVTVEHDFQNKGKYRVTWFFGSRIDERHTDCNIEQATVMPALFLDHYNGFSGNIVAITYEELSRLAAFK